MVTVTDITKLARRLFNRIEWQDTLETVTRDDLCRMIAEAIRYLYILVGKGEQDVESRFVYEEASEQTEEDPEQTTDESSETTTEEEGEETEPVPLFFTDDLKPDEQLYVIMTAELDFYKKVQSQYDGMTSYTTDAMAVTHGDAPFKNLQAKIDGAKKERDVVWWRMIRYNLL